MKTPLNKTPLLPLLAMVLGCITQAAQAQRQPIPYPGDRCPPSYHTENVQRQGGNWGGNIRAGYGPFSGGVNYNGPQYQQTYRQCAPNESRNMGNYPQPAPMPRPLYYQNGPMGPYANSTPMYRYPVYGR